MLNNGLLMIELNTRAQAVGRFSKFWFGLFHEFWGHGFLACFFQRTQFLFLCGSICVVVVLFCVVSEQRLGCFCCLFEMWFAGMW